MANLPTMHDALRNLDMVMKFKGKIKKKIQRIV